MSDISQATGKSRIEREQEAARNRLLRELAKPKREANNALAKRVRANLRKARKLLERP